MAEKLEDEQILYSSRQEVASIFSSVGVDLRLDDNDDGLVSTGAGGTQNEEQWLTDAIEEATDDINLLLCHFYSVEDLASSRWLRRRASYLAAHHLSERRGNAKQFCEKVEGIMKTLKRIRNGHEIVPGLKYSVDAQPAMSNLVVDRRFRNQLRVDTESQVGSPTQNQDDDYDNFRGFW